MDHLILRLVWFPGAKAVRIHSCLAFTHVCQLSTNGSEKKFAVEVHTLQLSLSAAQWRQPSPWNLLANPLRRGRDPLLHPNSQSCVKTAQTGQILGVTIVNGMKQMTVRDAQSMETLSNELQAQFMIFAATAVEALERLLMRALPWRQ